jgi:hypothetical protein
VARERRVVTPDGRVWYVRRRWAKRRLPWSRQAGQRTMRFDAEQELAAEEPVAPPIESSFTYSGRDLDHLGEVVFDRWHDDRHAAKAMATALVVVAVVVGLLAAAIIEYARPWLVSFVVTKARLILGVVAAVAVLVILDRLQRPWFVELQRQGLSDAPRRVWRVQGWWRSGRLMNQIAAAIREGRIDGEHATILFPGRDLRPPH